MNCGHEARHAIAWFQDVSSPFPVDTVPNHALFVGVQSCSGEFRLAELLFVFLFVRLQRSLR
jgi:hypothetical protein